MGAGVSDLSHVSDSAEIAQLAGTSLIAPNDPFWDAFLAFRFKKRLSKDDDCRLEERVAEKFNLLLTNNLQTGNLGSLMRVLLLKASDLKASAQIDSSVQLAHETVNALLAVRCVCKLLVQLLSEDELLRQLEARPVPAADGSPAAAAPPQPATQLETLLSALIEIVVDMPLIDTTYYIHVETLNLLLVLLACQMYSTKQAHSLVIYKTLMSGRSAIHACVLMKTLLRHVVERRPAAARYAGGGSLVLGLASGLWSALTLGYGSSGSAEEEGAAGQPPLARQSLQLLLVLCNHCTSEQHLLNPFRQALFNMSDLHASEPHLAASPDAFRTELSELYGALCRCPATDETTLLLYLLLHKNTAFRHYVLSRTDVDTLVLPTLRVLYKAPESSSHHIYMSLIVLLILSEDDLFNRSVHATMLRQIGWYTERPLTEISLGGLLILVVIRTIQYNMTKMRDKYLHTNCLAALANMSAEFRHLHPYVCQRLVSLFELLARRHARQLEQLRQTAARAETPDDDAMQDLSVLEEVLRMVLEIINSCLTAQLARNPNLVYTLLYKRSVFELYRTHPNFQDITQNIDTILLYFNSRLDNLHREIGVRDVLTVIEEGAKQFPLDRLKKFPELKFKYVEESDPEEFFIPYVWTLFYSGAELHWSPANLCLFAPDSVGS